MALGSALLGSSPAREAYAATSFASSSSVAVSCAGMASPGLTELTRDGSVRGVANARGAGWSGGIHPAPEVRCEADRAGLVRRDLRPRERRRQRQRNDECKPQDELN